MVAWGMLVDPMPYEYILYIDEAGDDGLKRIRPIDPDGASEWLCIGGVLIRQDNEDNVTEWVQSIRSRIGQNQGPVLHYRNLTEAKRLRACELLAAKSVVCFVVCSNKKNMRRHRNDRAAQRGGKQYFYNYCVRLLMERVTDLCLRDSMKRYGEARNLRVLFSQRGGHSYGQTKAYWEVLRLQGAARTTYLNKRLMRFEVLRYALVDYVPHTQNAGLQMADIVASAFYQACDTNHGLQNVEPATLLRPKMAREAGVIADFGLVLQPAPWKAQLTYDQQQVFEFYGYTF